MWATAVCFAVSLVLLIVLSVSISHLSSFDPKHVSKGKSKTFEPITGKLLPSVHAPIDAVCTFANLAAFISGGCLRVFKLLDNHHVVELGCGHPLPLLETSWRLSAGRDVVVAWCLAHMWVFRVTVSGLQLALKTEPRLGSFLSVQVQAESLVVQYENGAVSSAHLGNFEKAEPPLPAEMPVNLMRSPVVGLLKGHALVQLPSSLSTWELAGGALRKVPTTSPNTPFCCLSTHQEVFYLSRDANRVSAFDPKLNTVRSVEVARKGQVLVSLKALEPNHVVATTNTGHFYCLNVRDKVPMTPHLVARDVCSDGSCFALSNSLGDLFVGHLNGTHTDFCVSAALR